MVVVLSSSASWLVLSKSTSQAEFLSEDAKCSSKQSESFRLSLISVNVH